MIDGLLFTYGFTVALLVVNALRAPASPTKRLPPMWLFGMIASEPAGMWALAMPGVTALAFAAGGVTTPVGRWGVALTATAWVGQLEIWRRSRVGAARVGPMVDLPDSPLARYLTWPYRLPDNVERTEVEYAAHPLAEATLGLDLYRPARESGALPLVIYLHGGGWRGGDRRRAGQTIIHHLARSGWAVAAIDYPLSPKATFPDHLIGVDAAIAWADRRPDIAGPIVLMGGSAGGHLAAVAALTRPGVAGCIPMYGIYDFRNRHRIRVDWPLIPEIVMKTTPDLDPDLYRQASPLDLVHPDAPPFLVVHGTFDSLVPPREGHELVAALRSHGVDVTDLDVPWAQHGFDTFAGRRTRAVAGRVAAWLADRFPQATQARAIRRPGADRAV